MPGTIPVDESGKSVFKGPDTTNLIFVETGDAEITWEYAWKDGRCYSVKPILVNHIPLELGVHKQTGTMVLLQPSKGNMLWQLQLMPSGSIPPPEILQAGEVLVQGKYRNKIFTRKISKPEELSVPDAM